MKEPFWLVTGATDGIGLATAGGLVRAGRPLLLHGRTQEKAERAANSLRSRSGSAVVRAVAADFTSLSQVRVLADNLLREGDELAGIVHNAGAMFSARSTTADGWEATWQVNHLAPFLLHSLLESLLVEGARVVWVSSGLHASGDIPWKDINGQNGWNSIKAYSNSKLANVLTALRIARHHPAQTLGSFALHPGVIGTKMLKQNFGMGGLSPEEGAKTSLFAALDSSLEGRTGLYLDHSRVSTPSSKASDQALGEELWNWTVKALSGSF